MSPRPQWEEIERALAALLSTLPTETSPELPLPQAALMARLRKDIGNAIERLSQLKLGLDPIKPPATFFDPADPVVVGQLIARTMLAQPRVQLGDLRPFYGSGVYALYYSGTFPAYLPVCGRETPLYVGKADPRAPSAASPQEQGRTLSNRLSDHAKSITYAENLAIEDFHCRYLVVKSAWQNTAETYLIDHFKPIWNRELSICYGFGKHGDDPNTRKNTRSPWDTLHPGRPWAGQGNLPYSLSPAEISAAIAEHFAANPPRE